MHATRTIANAIAFCLLMMSTGVHLHPQRELTSTETTTTTTKNNNLKIKSSSNHEHNDATAIVLMLVKTEKEATAAVKTLNSFIANATTINDEKPVSKHIDPTNIYIVESKNNDEPVNISIKNLRQRQRQAKQLNMPFIPISMNWISNLRPQSGIVVSEKPPLRIWAIGSVSKFPTFIENLVQRVQSYYSIYKYHDLSRPVAFSVIRPQYHQGDAIEELIEIETDTPAYDDDEEATTDTISYEDPANTESTEVIEVN